MQKALSTLYRSSDSKDIAVTLLGFAGAQNAHINKYAQLYRDRGYDTIHFTSLLPTKYDMQLKNTREISSVVEHLREVLKEKEIVLHTFSMNGVFTLCSIQLQYPELNLLAKTRGIFFDSGPVDLGFRAIIPSLIFIDRYHKNILESGDQSLIKEYQKQKINQFMRLTKHYTILPYRRLMQRNVDDISAYDFLLNHPDLPSVMSFVYSKTDYICNYRSIHKFATSHKEKGRSIEELCLKDTPHVDHYRKYPNEYQQIIDRFLNNLKPRCLSQ